MKRPWIATLDFDVGTLVAPNAPSIFRRWTPKGLYDWLGPYDFMKWHCKLLEIHVQLKEDHKKMVSSVSGRYLIDDNWIEITIHRTSDPNLRFLVIQTILHELIHVGQLYNKDHSLFTRRTCRLTGDTRTDYLTQDGELEAYAHCLLLESQDNPTLPLCETFLQYQDVPTRAQNRFLKFLYDWQSKYKSYGIILPEDF
jgi:hypothetical protein